MDGARRRTRLVALGWLATVACVAACGSGSGSGEDSEEALVGAAIAEAAPPIDAKNFEVPPPPFSEGVFPCTECHNADLPVNTRKRKLKVAHKEIELKHDAEHRWCLDCHDAADRDSLHLANGEKVPFEESYRLCGQCHGEKFRDWRAGVHGRRTGHWDGEKKYLLCVNCHNSHAPHFAPLKPEAPPRKPEKTP